MSGHSRWSTIKHKKAAADAKRGRAWTKLIKEVTIAARMGGGDINSNPRLRKAADACRAVNMPAENITRAIKRGTGELEGMTYEEITYEGIGPSGVLLMVEAITDNRNRTAAELRKIFEKNGGSMGAQGSAGWAFERKGIITIEKAAATEEQLFDVALGAGAEDLSSDDELWTVTTPGDALDVVSKALETAKVKIKNSQFAQVAKDTVLLNGEAAETALGLADALDDHDDVQNVWGNFDVSEEAANAAS